MNIEARFYETYEICGIIDEVIRNPYSHLLTLEGFYCDGGWLYLVEPYKKYSILHKFIEYMLRGIHDEQAYAVDLKERQRTFIDFQDIPEALKDIQPTKLPIELAFDHYEIEYENFVEYLKNQNKNFESSNEDDIYEYMIEVWITEPYANLIDLMVKEIFHILFQNRELLLFFNTFISYIIEDSSVSEIDDDNQTLLLKKNFKRDGTLKRVNPPVWAQRAIIFRDRGQCVLCNKDVSGLINLANIKNFDHIIPLSRYGLNYISNLQLLCLECNQQEKRDNFGYTSINYQSWYSYQK